MKHSCTPCLLQGLHCRVCRGHAQVQLYGCKSDPVREGPVASTVLALGGQRGVLLLGCWLQGVRHPMAGAVPSTARACEECCRVTSQPVQRSLVQGKMHPCRLFCPGLGQALWWWWWWWLFTSSVLAVAEDVPPRTCRAGHTAGLSGELPQGSRGISDLGSNTAAAKGRREEEVGCCLP